MRRSRSKSSRRLASARPRRAPRADPAPPEALSVLGVSMKMHPRQQQAPTSPSSSATASASETSSSSSSRSASRGADVKPLRLPPTRARSAAPGLRRAETGEEAATRSNSLLSESGAWSASSSATSSARREHDSMSEHAHDASGEETVDEVVHNVRLWSRPSTASSDVSSGSGGGLEFGDGVRLQPQYQRPPRQQQQQRQQHHHRQQQHFHHHQHQQQQHHHQHQLHPQRRFAAPSPSRSHNSAPSSHVRLVEFASQASVSLPTMLGESHDQDFHMRDMDAEEDSHMRGDDAETAAERAARFAAFRPVPAAALVSPPSGSRPPLHPSPQPSPRLQRSPSEPNWLGHRTASPLGVSELSPVMRHLTLEEQQRHFTHSHRPRSGSLSDASPYATPPTHPHMPSQSFASPLVLPEQAKQPPEDPSCSLQDQAQLRGSSSAGSLCRTLFDPTGMPPVREAGEEGESNPMLSVATLSVRSVSDPLAAARRTTFQSLAFESIAQQEPSLVSPLGRARPGSGSDDSPRPRKRQNNHSSHRASRRASMTTTSSRRPKTSVAAAAHAAGAGGAPSRFAAWRDLSVRVPRPQSAPPQQSRFSPAVTPRTRGGMVNPDLPVPAQPPHMPESGDAQPLLPVMPDPTACVSNAIAPATLGRVLRGEVKHYERVLVLDCRFSFEFQGGHILPALPHVRVINILSPAMLEETLFSLEAMRANADGPRTLIVVHCEYSQKRGPLCYRFVREQDRALVSRTQYKWPATFYPETYLLQGGFKKFFEWDCEQQQRFGRTSLVQGSYCSMKDSDFAAQCAASYRDWRQHWLSRGYSGSLVRDLMDEEEEEEDSDEEM